MTFRPRRTSCPNSRASVSPRCCERQTGDVTAAERGCRRTIVILCNESAIQATKLTTISWLRAHPHRRTSISFLRCDDESASRSSISLSTLLLQTGVVEFMKSRVFLSLAVVAAITSLVWASTWRRAEAKGGRDFPGVVYVSSQGLFYDTFVSADELPPHGRFQLLVDGVTEFGPGDRGYVGGRWKVPNGMGGYDYLLCPLIPPGRPVP